MQRVPRADLRLIIPAAATWAAAAAGGYLDLRTGVVLGACLATIAAVLALRRTAAAVVIAVAGGCAAAGFLVSSLLSADVSAGPLRALAQSRARVTVDVTVTGDPEVVHVRSRSTA